MVYTLYLMEALDNKLSFELLEAPVLIKLQIVDETCGYELAPHRDRYYRKSTLLNNTIIFFDVSAL